MIALTAISTFLSKHAWKLIGGALGALVIMYGVSLIKDSGRAEVTTKVLQETIRTSNDHVRIEEEQSEIYNRNLTDAELFDSLQRTHSF